jgi:hypothetical protein
MLVCSNALNCIIGLVSTTWPVQYDALVLPLLHISQHREHNQSQRYLPLGLKIILGRINACQVSLPQRHLSQLLTCEEGYKTHSMQG